MSVRLEPAAFKYDGTHFFTDYQVVLHNEVYSGAIGYGETVISEMPQSLRDALDTLMEEVRSYLNVTLGVEALPPGGPETENYDDQEL